MLRRLTPELLDDPAVSRRDLESAMRFIRDVNRNMGGVDAMLTHLRAWSSSWPRTRPITLLDIGTGSADLPLAAVQWARSEGFDLRVTAMDKHALTLEIARSQIAGKRGVTLLQGDALTLDERFEPGSFDYTHAGLFLHHLDDRQVVTVLRSMNRIARAGIIWNDLMRSRLGHAVITLMTLLRPRIVRHDSRVSVAAGFTKDEVAALAKQAGIEDAEYTESIRTHRFTLAGEKPGAWPHARRQSTPSDP
jgi:hypothetical protein